MSQDHIDDLLVRYLGLLDEYTKLRQELSKIQSSVYQDIARANFSAERGLRYGQDHYDERMQALRLLEVTTDEKADVPVFRIKEAEAVNLEESTKEPPVSDDQDVDEKPEKEAANAAIPAKRKNPLHWFGLFVPMPLRSAQSHSVEAVERVIPRLVSVNAEMLNLEIEVGRARKKRAKAEAAAQKQNTKDGSGLGESHTPGTAVEAS